jgi:hypothetical protein
MKRIFFAALTSLWLISFCSFALRFAYLWHQQRSIPHQVLAEVPFAQETGNIAFALSEGRGFSNVFRQQTGPTAWLPPVYPLTVAGVFCIFGPFTYHAWFAAALLNCIFSALTCIPIFFLGRRLGGLPTAALAAWLWAFYPHAILIPVEWMWETSLSALLAACLLWATLALSEKPRRLCAWAAYGALWGFALLTNPSLAAALPFLFGWLLYRTHRSHGPIWKPATFALGTVLLVCFPWTLRNYAEFHRLLPLRSNFAFELWIGNNDIFDPHAIHGIQRITRYEQIRRYSELGETAFMQEKWRLAVQFMRSHPALELQLIARRFVATWFGTESPLTDFLAADSFPFRGILLTNLIVALATLLGLALLFLKRNPLAFPLAVFPVAFPVVYYLTHTSLRYRHPADPVLILLLAVSLLRLAGFRESVHDEKIRRRNKEGRSAELHRVSRQQVQRLP